MENFPSTVVGNLCSYYIPININFLQLYYQLFNILYSFTWLYKMYFIIHEFKMYKKKDQPMLKGILFCCCLGHFIWIHLNIKHLCCPKFISLFHCQSKQRYKKILLNKWQMSWRLNCFRHTLPLIKFIFFKTCYLKCNSTIHSNITLNFLFLLSNNNFFIDFPFCSGKPS